MIDYKAIADDDPGGSLEAAFQALLSMTTASTPERLMNYRSIAKLVGFSQSFQLEQAVKAAESSNTLPSWVNSSLKGTGIDVNDPQVEPLLVSLVGQTISDNISAAGVVSSLKYPNIKIGHLANARQKRNEGVI